MTVGIVTSAALIRLYSFASSGCDLATAEHDLARALEAREDFLTWESFDDNEAEADLGRYIARLDRLVSNNAACLDQGQQWSAMRRRAEFLLHQAVDIHARFELRAIARPDLKP
jgi:hypothetical protein